MGGESESETRKKRIAHFIVPLSILLDSLLFSSPFLPCANPPPSTRATKGFFRRDPDHTQRMPLYEIPRESLLAPPSVKGGFTFEDEQNNRYETHGRVPCPT